MYDRFIISFLRALKEQEGDDFGILNNQKLRNFFLKWTFLKLVYKLEWLIGNDSFGLSTGVLHFTQC